MADGIESQSIDKLHIDISVGGLTKKTINLIDSFGNSLKKLDEILTPKLMENLDKLSDITFAMAGMKEYLKARKKIGSALKDAEKLALPSLENEPDTNEEEKKADLKADEKKLSITDKLKNTWIGILKTLGKSDEEIKKINSKTGKLWGQIKRIALYRGIRSLLKFIASTINTGIQNLAKYDKTFNSAMSSLATSVTQIGNSLALMVAPIIEALAPLVTQIASGFMSIGNQISWISAMMRGVATYTKVSVDYAKDYAKQLQKAKGFSFDTFNTLGSDESGLMFTEEVKNGEKINGYALSILGIIGAISAIGIVTKVVKLVQSLSTIGPLLLQILPTILILYGVVGLIGSFVSIITDGATWQNMIIALTSILALAIGIGLAINPIGGLITGIIGLVAVGMALLIHYWEQIKTWFASLWTSITKFFSDIWTMAKELGKKWANIFIGILNVIVKGFEYFINKMINFINGFTSGLSSLWTWIGIPAIPAIPNVNWTGIQYLKDGGDVSAGTMFVAGEAGAEIVSDLGGGKTGVTNMEQLTQAIVTAIYQTNLLGTIEESGNIYLDSEKVGKKVGQSQSLRDSLNRTNPNLRLR